MKKIVVAIDGYSSCGKSTLAKQLAKHVNYLYIDTGAMYRAVALYALQNQLFVNSELLEEELVKRLDDIDVSFSYNIELNLSETCLNGKNVEKEIRGIEVSKRVSRIAKVKQVRQKMVKMQQKIGENKGIIMDGRDIGSVVFPDAELKIFMTADYRIRARRRYEELEKKGDSITYEEVLKNIELRDNDDSSRTENPLIKVDDAIVIDNSKITQQEQFDLALGLLKDKLA